MKWHGPCTATLGQGHDTSSGHKECYLLNRSLLCFLKFYRQQTKMNHNISLSSWVIKIYPIGNDMWSKTGF